MIVLRFVIKRYDGTKLVLICKKLAIISINASVNF